jgi:hypothetical protein
VLCLCVYVSRKGEFGDCDGVRNWRVSQKLQIGTFGDLCDGEASCDVRVEKRDGDVASHSHFLSINSVLFFFRVKLSTISPQ